MSLNSNDVILLSSDDECDSPPLKKHKSGIFGKEALDKLTRLKEITTAVCLDKQTNFRKTKIEKNQITIEIADENISKENGNNVVDLIDESPDISIVTEQKHNISGDCLILGSDSDSEASTPDPPKCTRSLPENSENGKESPTQNSDEIKDIKRNGTVEKKDEENRSIDKEIEKVIAHPASSGSSEQPKSDKQDSEKSEEAPIENEEILNRPSTSTASEAHKLLDEFLDTCSKSMRGSKYESKVTLKFPKMKNNFDKCESIHKEPNFQRMLQEHTVTAKIAAPEAVVSFQRVYSFLLDHINGDSIEVEEGDLINLKRLEKTCKRLLKRLKVLENAELNFDDDEDSAFIQIDRLSKRLNRVYTAYCQLLKRSPYSGRLLHERIQFTSSRHNEINRAITKSYKHNKFPSYYDIEKCIRKCVSKNALALSECDIKEESRNCFTKMGNLLQMRRKKELYEVHGAFITLNEDPANNDEDLKLKLQESLHEGEMKMKQVVEKYARMQDSNVNVELSEDSDDSNYKESESDTEGD